MKSAIVFFLSLCFLILGRHDSTFAKTATIPFTKKTHQLLSKSIPDDTSALKRSSLPEKKEELISLADEDEDLVFSKKNLQATKSFLIPGHSAIPQNCSSYLAKRLPFCRHFSYTASHKYILQRVLRI